MTSSAATVEEYLAELPEDRRAGIQAIRAAILANLPEGYQETMQYGMIGYSVPHSIYPKGYHCDPKQPLPLAGLASQKNHLAVYLMTIYGDGDDAAWFRTAWAATGKKLDMGKACIRARKAADLALDVIGEAIRRVPVADYVARFERMLAEGRERRKKA